MTDKQLKKLRRVELLEMLLEQTKENDRLREENAQLRSRLESRDIAVQEAGSIAEAALRLNGIFEAAQLAADQYLHNVKRQTQEASHEENKEA